MVDPTNIKAESSKRRGGKINLGKRPGEIFYSAKCADNQLLFCGEKQIMSDILVRG